MKQSFGVCLLTSAPLRERSAHSSQMVSQLLFGMAYEVLGLEGHWYKVRVLFDSYEGFLHRAQHTPIGLDYVQAERVILSSGGLILQSGSVQIPVLQGSELPVLVEKGFQIAEKRFEVVQGEVQGAKSGVDLAYLRDWMGVSYLWGGLSHWGADCSGFVQTFFKVCGIQIGRDSWQQALEGEEIEFGDQQAGDAVFFGEDRITHTGILLGEGRVVHCYGYVREDQIDPVGVYSKEFREHTHRLKTIRRYAGS